MDVPLVDMPQAGGESDLPRFMKGLVRRGRQIGHAEVGVERREMERLVRS